MKSSAPLALSSAPQSPICVLIASAAKAVQAQLTASFARVSSSRSPAVSTATCDERRWLLGPWQHSAGRADAARVGAAAGRGRRGGETVQSEHRVQMARQGGALARRGSTRLADVAHGELESLLRAVAKREVMHRDQDVGIVRDALHVLGRAVEAAVHAALRQSAQLRPQLLAAAVGLRLMQAVLEEEAEDAPWDEQQSAEHERAGRVAQRAQQRVPHTLRAVAGRQCLRRREVPPRLGTLVGCEVGEELGSEGTTRRGVGGSSGGGDAGRATGRTGGWRGGNVGGDRKRPQGRGGGAEQAAPRPQRRRRNRGAG